MMSNEKYIGLALGFTGFLIGLYFYPIMTLAIFLMLWGENLQRGE